MLKIKQYFSTQIYTETYLLTAYVLVHSFEIVSLSETDLNFKTSTHDQNLEMPGYCMLRPNHTSNNKRGSVCLFHGTNFPFRVLNILYLSEYITFEISIGNKVCHSINLYRLTNQIQDKFKTFKSHRKLDLDVLLRGKSILTVAIGDFNTKSKDSC